MSDFRNKVKYHQLVRVAVKVRVCRWCKIEVRARERPRLVDIRLGLKDSLDYDFGSSYSYAYVYGHVYDYGYSHACPCGDVYGLGNKFRHICMITWTAS